MKPALPSDDRYRLFVAELKERVRAARTSAARAVNRDLVLLYWDLGRAIVEQQAAQGWGDSVVEQLAADLRREFPGMSGFSTPNVWRMRQLYQVHTSKEFLSQAVRELAGNAPEKRAPEFLSQTVRELVASIPWGHHANVLAKVTDPAARLYYLQATAKLGWSRNVLLNQIQAGAFERAVQERKTHNFDLALPAHLAEQADEMLKSRYSLEFLGLRQAVRERELEDRLVGHLRDFILELGYGFCFVGRQHRLVLGRKEYFVDLLFYHRFLKALVAIDLKIGPFEPEFAGKMDFYPVRYSCHEPVLLRLRPSKPGRWKLLHRLHQRPETAHSRTQRRRRAIHPAPSPSRTRLLRSLPQPRGRYASREIPEDRLGQTLPQEPAEGLSNGVNLNLLNETERAADDRPSIGIILCAEKDSLEVEFALKTKANPIGVAEYQLQAKLPVEFKGKFPTVRQLTEAIRPVLNTVQRSLP